MNKKSRLLQIAVHVGFAVILIGIIAIIWMKVSNFLNGRVISQDEFDNVADDVSDTESLDFFLPLITDAEHLPVDDGETTIVCFGNNPFSDERDSDTNICNLIAEATGATVYNCSIPGSYMGALQDNFRPEIEPMDGFSFYWLTTTFCMDNFQVFDRALEAMPDADPVIAETVELIRSIDFSKVDVITLMFDGSEYLANRPIVNGGNPTDPQYFTGSMSAGIELIQYYYPHIRIIVMSPTYAYAVDEDGSYVSSDRQLNDWGYLSTYVIMQGDAAYDLSVSFVDNLYGTIHEDIAEEYLIDNLHLNEAGRRLVAERFVEALNKYPDPVIQ